MEKFSEFVSDKLKRYVYRLIDPRDGSTFYVGRGQGNRVFSHAMGQLEYTEEQNNDNLKLQRIRDIRAFGFEVGHVIHRHGMDESQVKEVESALIDAYPGLLNIAGGYGAEHGVMHAKDIIRQYEAEEADLSQHKLLVVNVGMSYKERNLYDATRHSWPVAINRVENAEYVLSVKGGVVIGVFKPEKWMHITPENLKYFPGLDATPDKCGFIGAEAPEEIRNLYFQKRIPKQKRGAQSPIRYFNM
jgi:uncharacterized protein